MANIITTLALEMNANWYVSKKLNSVGRVGENTVTKLTIEPTEILDNVTYELEIMSADGSKNVAELTIDGTELYLILTANMLTTSGITKMQVRAVFEDGSIKKSNIFELKVNRSISATDYYEEYAVTIFDQLVAECRDIIEGAESYAVRAETAANNASASATSAATDATNAAISEANASASATAASNSATSATTAASNASNSATNAAASASSASTSAANASTSATNAANSATSAATSATNAAVSATNASTSETNASASATEAAETAESIAASVAQINENTYRINDLEAIISGYQLTDLPTGAIASITDGTALLMPDLKVGIEPVQDLHGYDHPWAGGAGKNLFPQKNVEGVTSVVISGLNITPGTYTLSAVVTSADTDDSLCLIVNETTSSALARIGRSADRTSTMFTTAVTITSIRIYASVNYALSSGDAFSFKDIQLEEGSTATSYEPYSNICPISGWTAANVTRTGKNMTDGATNGHYINTDGTLGNLNSYRCTDYVNIDGIAKLKATVSTTYPNFWIWRIASYDINKNFIELSLNRTIANGDFEEDVTLPSNAKYIRACAIVNSTNWNIYDKTTFSTYTIQFRDGDNPLTVYGGTLDVITGELVVDRASVDLGTLDWTYVLAQTRFYTQFNCKGSKDNNTVGNIICSTYMSDTYNNVVGGVNDASIAIPQNGDILTVRDSRYTDVIDFKTAMNGVQLVYELATPITYHLTPTQVRTLVGNNNIWADTGDVLSGKYFRSPS